MFDHMVYEPGSRGGLEEKVIYGCCSVITALFFWLKFVGLAFAHCFILNPERKKKCLTCLGITYILILQWLSENCLTFDLGSTPALTMLSIPLWHCVYSSYFVCSKYVGALP